MNKFLENKTYINALNKVRINIEYFKNKTFLISGASGLIGSCLVDYLLLNARQLNNKLYLITRNKNTIYDRFNGLLNDNVYIIEADLNVEQNIKIDDTIDYVIHAASNTHPSAYAIQPINTIMTNVIGLNNLLKISAKNKESKTLFLSSVEIYGDNDDYNHLFTENDLGYINCNTLRAGYPESKRLGEALCQAYIAEKNIDVRIARLCRVYGPTMKMSDSKAMSQFIKNALNGENIILKSEGNQFFSYLYVIDVINAIMTILTNGSCGEAYNVADENSNIRLKELAKIIADYANKSVLFETPNNVEKTGFSKANIAILDSKKLKEIGWTCNYKITVGIAETIEIMRHLL